MDIIKESGFDSVLFVGEGFGEIGSPAFSTESGQKILRDGIKLLGIGIRPYFVEFRKSNDEDIIDNTHIEEFYKYVKVNNISKIFCLGKSITVMLFPSITKSLSITNLVNSALVTPIEIPVKVGVLNHPISILKSADEDALSDWINRLYVLLTEKVEIDLNIKKITSEEEFLNLLKHLNNSKSKFLGLDYETNAVDPFHKDHYITMVGLSELTSDMTANAWYYIPPKIWSESTISKYADFLEQNCNRVWTYNVSFEMKVTWHLTGKYIKLQDAMVLVTMFNKRGSLKNVVRSELGALMWEYPVKEFMSFSEKLFDSAAKLPELIEACKTGNLFLLKESTKTSERLNWMLENYSEEEVIEGLSHYPYIWASVPKELLGVYCAQDAGNTVILANKYYQPHMIAAYNIYICHPYLATKFEVNGIPWKDSEASILAVNVAKIELDLLYNVIKDCDISNEARMEADSIYYRDIPYEVIWYTEKTKQPRSRKVNTQFDKLEELKNIFNPSSNSAESRSKFWNNYGTEEIKLATILLLFLEDIELTGKLPDLYKVLGDKSFLYTNKPNKVLEKILSTTTEKTSSANYIKHSLAKATNKLSENTGKFAIDIIKFQYKVHTSFLNLNIEDTSNWTKEWKMLFNMFLYKKHAKMYTANIQGSTGRDSVYQQEKLLHGKPLRGKSYWEVPESEKNNQMVLSVGFNSLAAASLRWTSGFHTISPGSSARRCFIPTNEREVWIHSDMSQAELTVLAYLSQDKGMIQSFIDGRDMHKFIASKVFSKSYDDVTSEERKASKSIGFGIIYGKSIENTAIEITGGNVEKAQGLFDAFFNTFPGIKIWMDSKRDEVDKLGYVTTMFGNILDVDTTAPGNSKYRVACNAPIQCISNTIAGTSMFQFTEACEKLGIKTRPVAFIHDALDDILGDIDDLFDYIDLLVLNLQTNIYNQLGIPMRIDYEVGADSFHLCHIKIKDKNKENIIFELSGEEESLTKMVDKISLLTKFNISEILELKSSTISNSYAEMFTIGKALKENWGKVVTEKVLKITLVKK